MITLLNKIKPKRLSETLKGYVFQDRIVLDFGATKVVCLGDTGIRSTNPLCLSHKDLYNQELDNAQSVDFKFNLKNITLWKTIDVETVDNNFFSAISGTGEDIYWSGIIGLHNTSWDSKVFGINYLCEYRTTPSFMTKESILMRLDYHMFYYLFQFTKHLNGKKKDILYWHFDFMTGYFYITNTDRDYYVVCDQRDKVMEWKTLQCIEIAKIYQDKDVNLKQVFKKVLNESASPLFKALSRPFGDVLNTEEKKNFNLYQDDKYKLWVLKNK